MNSYQSIRGHKDVKSSVHRSKSMALISNDSEEFIQFNNSIFNKQPQQPDTCPRRNLKHSASGPSTPNVPSILENDSELHEDYDINKRLIVSKSSDLEEYNGSSWELWWLNSLWWKRGLIFMVVVLGIITITEFIFAFLFLTNQANVKDPYICKSDNCKDLARWLNQSRNMDVSPCDDFYDFMCGNHETETDDEKRRNLYESGLWLANFGRLDTNGESILAQILKKTDDPIGKHTIKFYQSCVNLKERQKDEFQLKFYVNFLKEIFGDFNLWDNKAEPSLEIIASRMIHKVGDYGFFKIETPINYPRLFILPHANLQNIEVSEENYEEFISIIYEALKIPVEKQQKITAGLVYMTNRLIGKINSGIPKCSENTQSSQFDLFYPIWYSYFGKDSIQLDGTKWTLKKDYKMIIEVFPIDFFQNQFQKNYKELFRCWDLPSAKIAEEDIRAVYATFWAVHLLISVAPGILDSTAEKYKFHTNPIFRDFQSNYYKRSLSVRCYASLLDFMGYVPIFSYFMRKDLSSTLIEVNTVIREAANGLLNNWNPPEEGGLGFISSKYRERGVKILSGDSFTSILFPAQEDDYSNPFDMPFDITESHMSNAARWKSYSQNRTIYYWISKSPRNKLVWYRNFYNPEKVNAFEAPSFTDYNMIKFPASMFVKPYWNNDLTLANFAGVYYQAAKAWLILLEYDFLITNIEEDIQQRFNQSKLYREGSMSDGDFRPCEIYAYDWNTKSGNKAHFSRETTDPHSFVFRFGWGSEMKELHQSHFYSFLATKMAYDLYFETIDKLSEKPYWKLPKKDQQYLTNKRLVYHEEYSEKQLFFMIQMRDACRSGDSESELEETKFLTHVSKYNAPLMQSKIFSDAWNCPIGSPMNPTSKCY